MSRVRSLAAFVALLVFSLHPVPASGIILFFDPGDPVSGVQGGSLTNSNPRLTIPVGRSGSLHVWAIPDQDNQKVIVSLGHDVLVSGAEANAISAIGYTLANPSIDSNNRWNGVNLRGGLNVSGKLVYDQRAVFVPQAAPFIGGLGSANLSNDPTYDAESGAVYVGRLDLEVSSGATPGAEVNLHLAMSDLLIVAATTGTPAEEPVFFGFDGNGPEVASGTGSVAGASSTIPDAVMIILSQGSFDSDGDGDVDLADYANFFHCVTGPGPAAVRIDCQLFDSEPDSDVDLVDFHRFQMGHTVP